MTVLQKKIFDNWEPEGPPMLDPDAESQKWNNERGGFHVMRMGSKKK